MNTIVDLGIKAKSDAELVAAAWGWSIPSDEILTLAASALEAQSMKTGDLLVHWSVLSREERDALLRMHQNEAQTENRPKFLSFCVSKEPAKVTPVYQKALTLHNGFPYYEHLRVLTVHEDAMSDRGVHRACDKLSAVLMMVEQQTPVLVFADFATLLAYSVRGKQQVAADDISRYLGLQSPHLAVGPVDDINALLRSSGGEGGTSMGLDDVPTWLVAAGSSANNTAEIQAITRVMDHAIKEGASDVWLSPMQDGSIEIWIRKWGVLVAPFRQKVAGVKSTQVKTVLSPELASKVVNLLMSKSSANGRGGRIFEPVDGWINYQSEHQAGFMRLNFIPLNLMGEAKDLRSVSVRLFDKEEKSVRLADLNIPPHIIAIIRDAVQMPKGLILISAPMNSGKSATMIGAIGEHVEIFGDERKRATLEDPVEQIVRGLMPIQASHRLNEKDRFAKVLRGIKRHDVDLMLVGEIRDEESADFAVRFSNAGHITLSTTHSSNSISGVEAVAKEIDEKMHYLLVSGLSLSVSQRLVKRLCPCCSKKNEEPTESEKRRFLLNLEWTGESAELPMTVSHRGDWENCGSCDRGYIGVLPVVEVLRFTREVKELMYALLRREDVHKNSAALREKTVTLLRSGLDLVNAGETELESVLFFD